VDFLDIFVA